MTDNRKWYVVPKTGWTFCSLTMQFLVDDRCRNRLANLLSSWKSSKIPNLALEFRRYLPEFHRCNSVLEDISILPVVCRGCTYLPKLLAAILDFRHEVASAVIAEHLDVSYIVINPCIVFETTSLFVKPRKLLLLPVI